MQSLTVSKRSGAKASKFKVTFLGGGSFGTAMANLAAINGARSTLWVRSSRTVKQMTSSRYNKKYLPDFRLSDNLSFSSDIEEAVRGRDIIFVAVPSHAFRGVLQSIAPFITSQAIVSLTKGMEKESLKLMSEVIQEELPNVAYGVISGPNLAKEIMGQMPSATVIASTSEALREAVAQVLNSALFRVFPSDDVPGVELGGALKNIYAIAMGMASAHDVGENTKSMLLTLALSEMSRLGAAMGARPMTFLGLSGVGDLFATCSSELSRNFRMGKMLGEGSSVKKASKKLGQTSEGVNTIEQVRQKAQELGVDMPITDAMYEIIFEEKPPLAAAFELLNAGATDHFDFQLAAPERT